MAKARPTRRYTADREQLLMEAVGRMLRS